ncbi:uncharacterized protein LOC108622686 [Ceratina calcarata]|uniref:Uncharacterized protein LOC108622686 n=1 Tax=Ceratina calcarata TaxID=156304 RepID=A0AAJ7N3R4_9HYME|nr:uncharacterized protein LOC108622686 [Ceratina calcarata]
MDCCYTNKDGNTTPNKELANISSPEMFDSDHENEEHNEPPVIEPRPIASPQKPSQADLVAKSDSKLLARISKLLCGVPPPPKLTICRTDCSELLMRIYDNEHLFWTPCILSGKQKEGETSLEQKENISTNTYPHTKSTLRNLSTAFDACDPQYQNNVSDNLSNVHLKDAGSDNFRIETVVPTNDKSIVSSVNGTTVMNSEQIPETKVKHVSFAAAQSQSLLYYTVDQKAAVDLVWPEAYYHKYHGIHYNRSTAVEEFESLTSKLCGRYIGAETQSTCTVWFSKPAPSSAKKRSLLAKRNNGQSPGKRLSHLTRRRKAFSSANLQGLAMNNKKMVVLNIKKPVVKKGKSPRAKSPRGKSPRGKSPRGTPKSSTKKKVARRLVLDGPSPLKSKIETSKRALFQSPPAERAGPSKLFTGGSNPQSIKRALFTQNTKENDSEAVQKISNDDSKKRKNEEDLEGPRCKWAKSLSFDCSHELHNKTISWDRHSSSNIIEKTKLTEKRCELSDAHRKKLLWAVAEALRGKGIGMTHPLFKQYATNLARTIKKFMPDLENKNIPRKPGSTSDRMLKLAKHHVVYVIDARPPD